MRLYSHLILLIPLLLPLLTTSNNNLLDTYLLPNHPHEMSGARLGLPCLLINTSTRRDLSGFEYADAALALPPPPRAHKKKTIGQILVPVGTEITSILYLWLYSIILLHVSSRRCYKYLNDTTEQW